MTDRIKDLALEVIQEYMPLEAWAFNDRELQQFAELIINECIEQVTTELKYQRAGKILPNIIAERIRNHFGIK